MSILDSVEIGASWTKALASYAVWSRGQRTKGSGRVQAGDIDIYYKWFGRGEPILMLHGGFMVIEGFAAQIPSLSRSHLLIAMDSRGHGRTTLGTEPMTYSQLGRDAAALLDILQVKPVTVLGVSDGGNAALGLAVQRPDLVKGLVLMGTSLNLENRIADVEETTRSFLNPSSPELAITTALRSLINPERNSRTRFIEQMRRLWTEPSDVTLQDLSDVSAPTLIIAGDHDEFLSPPDDPLQVFEELRNAMPRARMTVIPGGHHGLTIEAAGTVNRLVLEFMADPYGEGVPEVDYAEESSRTMASRFASLLSTLAREMNR